MRSRLRTVSVEHHCAVRKPRAGEEACAKPRKATQQTLKDKLSMRLLVHSKAFPMV